MPRILLMFSVVTLALASPVYERIWETPGLVGLLRLVLLLQILPTAGLVFIDGWLQRRAPRAWSGWRRTLALVCLLSVARQAQVSFRLQMLSPAPMLLAVGGVAGLGLLLIRFVSVSQQVLVALAPGLLVSTFVTGYGLFPANAGTTLGPASPRRPAVFVLLFDELDRDMVMPDGQVRAELTNFRRLVAGSRAFVDATTNYSFTCASVGSLLAGRLLERPPPVGPGCRSHLRDLRENNLLTEVAQRFTVRVHAQYLRYCFDAAFECRGTAYVQARAPHLPLLQHYMPDPVRTVTRTEGMLGLSGQTYAVPVFEQFLSGLRASESRGTFHWVHVLLPHGPYIFDAQGAVHRPDYDDLRLNEGQYRRALAAYRRQVGFVDRLLGRFLDRLEAEGLAGEAIVIVTSDHGFFSLHPDADLQFIDGFEVNAARPRVPLLVRAPGLAPGLVADDYQHVDFRRLVLGLVDGAGAPEQLAPRDKVFCDGNSWYVRDAAGRWQPRLGVASRLPPC